MPRPLTPTSRKPLICVAMCSLALCLITACSNQTTEPRADADRWAGISAAGSLDPAHQTFSLKILTDPLPGHLPVPVELLGSNLQLDPISETVRLDVAIRNAGNVPLYSPAMVWIGDFVPDSVTVMNPDLMYPPDVSIVALPYPYGFDYSALLGADGVLTGGETSDAKTWIFQVPDLGAFAFGARVSFGIVPDLPRLAGMCFMDWNADGQLGPEEFGSPADISVIQPDGSLVIAHADWDGYFSLPVIQPGLYRVTCAPWELWDCICPIVFTTPNPLSVVMPPNADGEPVSFLDANFGFYLGDPGDPIPPVEFSELPPDSLRLDLYFLNGITLVDDVLSLDVSFSGCTVDHPFNLYMSGEFMESYPVQANLVLRHDGLGEACLTVLDRHLEFNLEPIRARYVDQYGEPGPVRLNFIDYLGQVHPLDLAPGRASSVD